MDRFSLLEKIPAGVIALEKDSGNVVYINEYVRRLLKISDIGGITKHTLLEMIDEKSIKGEILRQLEEKSTFEVECSAHIGNETLWLSVIGSRTDEEQESLWLVTLKDVTEQKESLQVLEQDAMLNEIALGLSKDIFFHVDLKSKTIMHSENVLRHLALNSTGGKFPQCIIDSGIIPRESIDELRLLAKTMYSGKKMSMDMPVVEISGALGWYHFEYDFLEDHLGQPIQAVGAITNVSSQKFLEMQVALDPLTQLYNKTAAQSMIEDFLYIRGSKGAFFIIDIDDFKSINDKLGHHFGDAVLVDIAEKIRHHFRDSDIIGRIGGDEFVIFIKNLSDVSIVEEKAKQISFAFRCTFTGENNKYKVSGSIGVALFPAHGSSYDEIYKNADCALYESKHKGKDCYTIYHSELRECIMSNPKPFEESKRYEAEYFEGHLLYRFFDMLYESSDIYATVNKILEIVGKTYNVDRCYVFETSDDGEIFNNTFEWCANNIEPQIGSLQNIPREDLDYALSRYNEEGIFYCNDISILEEPVCSLLKEQDIKSILHCGISVGQTVKFMFGFDECKSERVWQGIEIAAISYTAKLLSIYLMNREANNELRTLNQNKNTLLDNMSDFVYVIDRDTKEILFINKMVKELIPSFSMGGTCFKMAFGSETPCENCPVNLLTPERVNATLEIYNYKYNIWVLATASRIDWIGCKNAVLLSCTDISPYKKSKND